MTSQDDNPSNVFDALSVRESNRGLLADVREFLRVTGKWWLLPLLIVLLVVGLLILLSTSAIGPAAYPLF
ncbi:MAG: DUF5989 family protein [Planctomycetaceae bacterium]